jgi:hypothetical protein
MIRSIELANTLHSFIGSSVQPSHLLKYYWFGQLLKKLQASLGLD